VRQLFDAEWYLREYPDVAAADIDPLRHYLRFGRAEGRSPNAFFDPQWYAQANFESAEAGLDPLQHYLERGADQGLRPSLEFDPDWYASSHPDVPAGNAEAFIHFVTVGAKRGYLPHAPLSAVTVYTSFNLFYADRALVLLDSLRAFHPSWTVVAILVEPAIPEGPWCEALDGFDEVILARSLFPGEDFDTWIYQHDVVEACTAVKGQALEALLARGGDAVIYLDPDTQLQAPLTTVLTSLPKHSALLTPHLLTPATSSAAIWDGEIGSLKHGVFNLGFLAVRNCPEGQQLAQWWAERLKMACWDNPEMGLFTDQRWMDLAPAMFPNIGILHDPGTNVGVLFP
jgi:hypothetical protein